MRHLRPEDLLRLKIPSELTIDNSGEYICFQLKSCASGTLSSEIMLRSEKTDTLFTLGEGTCPAISPDGRYVAWARPGGNVLAVHSLRDGALSDIELFPGIAELSWDPDGNSLLLTCDVRRPTRQDYPDLKNAYLVDRLKFKADGAGRRGIWDETFRQIVRVRIAPNMELACEMLTNDERDHRLPFRVNQEAVGYVANNRPSPDLPDQYDRDSLFILTPDGKIREIVGPGGPIDSVAVSPDGKTLAFTGHDYRFFEATNHALYTISLPDGQLNRIPAPDVSCTNHVFSDIGLMNRPPSPCWLTNGDIACTVTVGGASELWTVDAAGNMEWKRLIVGQRAIYAVRSDRNDTIAFIFSTPDIPASIGIYKRGGEERSIWNTWDDDSSLPKALPVSEKPEAWYLPPVDGSPRGVVVAVHGGPHICYGYSFPLDFRIFSSAGYGVIYGNPAGSQGYGQAFSAASKHDWGGQDFRDLMNLVDAAREKYSLHNLPMAVIGASYGGFMVNWAIGHTSRFACAISERGTANRYSQAGTSDCAYRYGVYEFDGTPWENPEFYLEHSPISYVEKIKTPLLLIHGEDDMNCPISQSEEIFTALKVLEQDVLMARFSNSTHSFASRGEPGARIDRYNLILWWLSKYLHLKA